MTAGTMVQNLQEEPMDRTTALVTVPAVQAGRIETEEQLDELLQLMNFEDGETPVLVGVDAKGRRFLAYGWAPGGDGWQVNCTTDDPKSREFNYNDVNVCEDCGAHDRQPLSHLTFPVAVI